MNLTLVRKSKRKMLLGAAQKLFAEYAFGGFVGIILLKLLFSNFLMLLVITLASCVAIWKYSQDIIVNCKALSQEQVGDNCYYLGFIYTIASLSVALFSLSQGGFDPKNLMGAFGIGLASTLVGVVLRVWYSHVQMEGDEALKTNSKMISDLSEQLCSDLQDEVQNVQTSKVMMLKQFEEAEEKFGAFADKCAANLEKFDGSVEELQKSLKNNIDSITSLFAASFQEQSNKLADSTDKLSERINQIEVSPKMFEEKFNSVVGEVVNAVKGVHDLTAKVQENLETSMNKTMDNVKSLTEGVSGSVKSLSDGVSGSVKTLSDNVSGSIDASLKGTVGSLQSTVGEIVENIAGLGNASGIISENAGELSNHVASIKDTFASFATMKENMNALSGQMEKCVGAISKLNDLYDSFSTKQTQVAERASQMNSDFIDEIDKTKDNFLQITEQTNKMISSAIKVLDNEKV